MNTKEIRFVYVKPTKKRRGITTVAYRFNDTDKCIEYNSARCSTNDQFNKHTGRVKACGRLLSGKTNGSIPYESVANENGTPRYAYITAELISRFQ